MRPSDVEWATLLALANPHKFPPVNRVHELAAHFQAALPPGRRDAPVRDLEEHLRQYVLQAHGSWPLLDVPIEALMSHLAERAPPGVPPPAEHAGDMFLACGCLLRLESAISAFHSTYGAVISRVVARRKAAGTDISDVAQTIYEHLLVGRDGREPKIADYRGYGPLRSWISAVAAKTVLTAGRSDRRRRAHEGQDPATADGVLAVLNPELLYLKGRYRPEIEEAVRRAVERLDDRSGALLRLHFGQRLSIDHLGAMYRVNRATAARWVAAAREALSRAVRADLRRKLKLSESDYESLVALVRSELDVNVAGVLGSQRPVSAQTP